MNHIAETFGDYQCIIGLAGPKGCGKNTVADMIPGTQVAFADPIKDMLRVGLGLTTPQLEARDLKELTIPTFGKSPRDMMTTLGTEWGRDMIHPEIWHIIMRQRLVELRGVVLVTDVRFNNEAELIREMGGTVYHIQRPGFEWDGEHRSESGVASHPFDRYIYNYGDKNYLKDIVDASVIKD